MNIILRLHLINSKGIKQCLDNVYGYTSPLHPTVKKWAKDFRMDPEFAVGDPHKDHFKF